MSADTAEATVLPTPKRLTLTGGTLPLSDPVRIATVGEREVPARWLAAQIEALHGRTCSLNASPESAPIVLGLLGDLEHAGLAPEGWQGSEAFAGDLGRAQGYVLEVGAERAVLAAHTEAGLRHAAASLLQLIGPEGIRRVRIDDRPDFAFRAADWLLNAEINRWAYERGDGPEATLALMRRKLDLAARLKLNFVWFDGFGWDPDRAPGYAQFARTVAREARARGIRLAHAGYGGGYGFAYQRSPLYRARYMGRAYENRRPWPEGDRYDCIGEPSYPESRHHGTCLSNEAMQDAKLAELTAFVAACEPGLLYVHDIDTGRWAPAVQGWAQRCDECRRRWPSDDAAAEDGMAGAYAAWFARVVAAVGGVASADGEYRSERDCEVVFVGPVYSATSEPDADWEAQCRYFATISRLLGPAANVQFGFREQLLGEDGHPRFAQMAATLDAVGHGHGVFVVSFCGGDAYHSDQPVAPAPALNRYLLGARTAYVVNFGGVAEPAQVVAAQFAWNATAPGAAPLAMNHAQALGQLEAARDGTLRPAEIYGPGGLIERACELLYGPEAGPLLAEVFGADGPEAWPVVAAWPSFSRELRRLEARTEPDASARAEHWRSRGAATQRAAALVDCALEGSLPDPTRYDLSWLRARMGLHAEMCALLADTWAAVGTPDGAGAAAAAWADLAERLRASGPAECTDPLCGDIGAALELAEVLRDLTSALA